MNEFGRKADNASISALGLDNVDTVYWNLEPSQLIEDNILRGEGVLADSGALAIDTGEFTGRSPEDRFIVEDEITKDAIWWGPINKKFDTDRFDALYNRVTAYLGGKEVYARDAIACSSEKYSLPVRIITEFPYSNLFAYNMFIRPTEDQLKSFDPEWNVICAPGFKADPEIDGTRQHNFAVVNFSKKILLIGGTGYTGEIKKGIFSALNFILPHQKNVLSMHCSANVGEDGDTAIFSGLSGTGKTTLSSDPNRKLIGDDEHGWDDDSVFNFEGGCYAKTIDLKEENEPQIYRAIKFGALLENIGFKEGTTEVDFHDSSKTQNTRVSYPIHHIDNVQEGLSGPAPKNIFFLTCDAYGVLPPISKLTPGQAMYHFISGYTAKVAGTEAGITEPQMAFSACFGAPFMPLHPTKYAEMLGNKMEADKVNVWLINTGWSGGAYGDGSRIKLSYTRNMITSALTGKLDDVEYHEHEVFGLAMPTECEGVPSDILNPKNTWKDKNAYDKKAQKLAQAFVDNFDQFAEYANDEIMSAAPKSEVAA